MIAATLDSIKGKVNLNKRRREILVTTNIPFHPLISDDRLSFYQMIDFGYVMFFLAQSKSGHIIFKTDARSFTRNAVFKKACKAISSYATYATEERLIENTLLRKVSPKMTTKELKEFKREKFNNWSVDYDLDRLRSDLLSKQEEIELRKSLRDHKSLMLTCNRLAAKLHILSGSKSTEYLTDSVKHELINYVTSKGKP